MYSRDQIDQVRSRVDIVEVIREYVPSLKASGRSVKGLCPFHAERTPSFHVHPEKGLFKCFGCGEAGDVIGFISKMEQVGFSESLEMLADKAGVTLKKSAAVEKQEPEGIREKLYRVLEAASRIYEDQLWDARLGEPARAYLKEREILDETAQNFRLGFAPPGTSAFEVLVKKGFAIELCQTAGLATRSSAGRFYDPLFGRLIFPILDGFGHVVGFGGRVLPQTKKPVLGLPDEERDGDAPKYINSPETPVFSKGRLLYGLFQAKSHILAARKAMVLEGYMDVIGVHQGGFPFGVATLGTAFTHDHAKILKRYATEVLAFFDPDEAGQKAALRGLEPLVQEDFFTRVVVTEGDTDDPDDIIRKRGKEHFDGLIHRAPDFVDYMLKISGVSASSPLQEKADVAKQILAVIAQAPNEILKSEWSARVATALGFQPESLKRDLERKPAPRRDEPSGRPLVIDRSGRFIPSAEEEFLQLLISSPQAWPDMDLTVDDFFDERNRRVFAQLKQQVEKTGRVSVPALYENAEPADKEWLLILSLEEKIFANPVESREQLARDVRINSCKRTLAILSQKITSATASAEEQARYKDLLRRVKGSPRTAAPSVKQ